MIAATCGERVLALTRSVEAAVKWRRAAGWDDPFAADGHGRDWSPTPG